MNKKYSQKGKNRHSKNTEKKRLDNRKTKIKSKSENKRRIGNKRKKNNKYC